MSIIFAYIVHLHQWFYPMRGFEVLDKADELPANICNACEMCTFHRMIHPFDPGLKNLHESSGLLLLFVQCTCGLLLPGKSLPALLCHWEASEFTRLPLNYLAPISTRSHSHAPFSIIQSRKPACGYCLEFCVLFHFFSESDWRTLCECHRSW